MTDEKNFIYFSVSLEFSFSDTQFWTHSVVSSKAQHEMADFEEVGLAGSRKEFILTRAESMQFNGWNVFPILSGIKNV